jgi:hypothetical protein
VVVPYREEFASAVKDSCFSPFEVTVAVGNSFLAEDPGHINFVILLTTVAGGSGLVAGMALFRPQAKKCPMTLSL